MRVYVYVCVFWFFCLNCARFGVEPCPTKKKKMIFLSPRLQLEKQSVFLSVIRPIYLQTPSLTTNVILRCCVCTFFFFFFCLLGEESEKSLCGKQKKGNTAQEMKKKTSVIIYIYIYIYIYIQLQMQPINQQKTEE